MNTKRIALTSILALVPTIAMAQAGLLPPTSGGGVVGRITQRNHGDHLLEALELMPPEIPPRPLAPAALETARRPAPPMRPMSQARAAAHWQRAGAASSQAAERPVLLAAAPAASADSEIGAGNARMSVLGGDSAAPEGAAGSIAESAPTRAGTAFARTGESVLRRAGERASTPAGSGSVVLPVEARAFAPEGGSDAAHKSATPVTWQAPAATTRPVVGKKAKTSARRAAQRSRSREARSEKMNTVTTARAAKKAKLGTKPPPPSGLRAFAPARDSKGADAPRPETAASQPAGSGRGVAATSAAAGAQRVTPPVALAAGPSMHSPRKTPVGSRGKGTPDVTGITGAGGVTGGIQLESAGADKPGVTEVLSATPGPVAPTGVFGGIRLTGVGVGQPHVTDITPSTPPLVTPGAPAGAVDGDQLAGAGSANPATVAAAGGASTARARSVRSEPVAAISTARAARSTPRGGKAGSKTAQASQGPQVASARARARVTQEARETGVARTPSSRDGSRSRAVASASTGRRSTREGEVRIAAESRTRAPGRETRSSGAGPAKTQQVAAVTTARPESARAQAATTGTDSARSTRTASRSRARPPVAKAPAGTATAQTTTSTRRSARLPVATPGDAPTVVADRTIGERKLSAGIGRPAVPIEPASVDLPDNLRAFQATGPRVRGGIGAGDNALVAAGDPAVGGAAATYELVGTMNVAGNVRAILRVGARQFLVEPGSTVAQPDLPEVRVRTIARDRLTLQDLRSGEISTRFVRPML